MTAMVFITDDDDNDDDNKDMKDAIISAWQMNNGWIREVCRVRSHYRVRYT